MTLEGEEGVVPDHAMAIVGDANELAATSFDFDADAGGASVKGVFEELFDDGGGAFDDFAGGDLVRHEVREDTDASHESIVRRSETSERRLARDGSFGCNQLGGLAVTNLAVWWSARGKIMHRGEDVFLMQVEIVLDLGGFGRVCVGP